MAARLKVGMMLYLDPPQRAALEKLSKTTRVPMQEYLREAVDDVLKKYKAQLRRGAK